MKKLILILFLVGMVHADAYYDGWAAGWANGICFEKGSSCYAPRCPYPEYPKYGEDSYMGGYNRGFLAGLEKQGWVAQ